MTTQSKKILIVEDNKLLQQVYFDKLVKDGFVVLQAFTGQQGLALATNYNPDLIILDVMLPGGLNGFDVLSQLRANLSFKHTPIIMMTDLREEKKTAESIGASDYIIKDENQIDETIAKIKSYLNPDLAEKIKKILE
ncbi:response regulator [Candidatus Roizmanbacteria bacterium]|nr:response regulator [Candidatus Roizmanbacteria bacterium]